jgi:hypothetical protein
VVSPLGMASLDLAASRSRAPWTCGERLRSESLPNVAELRAARRASSSMAFHRGRDDAPTQGDSDLM